jgi:hypothetical protein
MPSPASAKPRRPQPKAPELPGSLLWLPRRMVTALLRCYDQPHPLAPGRIIRGYDKPHALRTAQMSATVAASLGHAPERVRNFQVACLLHDMGRAGLDRRLFGAIWTWARRQGIPTRPGEWRAAHPDTPYGRETEAFWKCYRGALQAAGTDVNAWAKEQVEMRLGYARRQHRMLKRIRPQLEQLGVRWRPWMEQVTLYYYYPEKLHGKPEWVRELAEVLVACEQLEAWSNRTRGNDYYDRRRENLADAFDYLEALRRKGQIGARVLNAVRAQSATGTFDVILGAARGRPLGAGDRRFLRGLAMTRAA